MPIRKTDSEIIDKLMCTCLWSGNSRTVLAQRERQNTILTDAQPLIYDDFAVAKATGAVNGSHCDTIGWRKCNDAAPQTIQIISAAGGYLIMNGGGAAWGDKYVVLKDNAGGGIAREAGTVFSAYIYLATGLTKFWIGLNTDDTPTQTGIAEAEHAILFNDDNKIDICNGTVVSPDIVTYATTTYMIRIVLKTSGAVFYISGGAFGAIGESWTILHDSNLGNSETLYPCMNTFGKPFLCYWAIVSNE